MRRFLYWLIVFPVLVALFLCAAAAAANWLWGERPPSGERVGVVEVKGFLANSADTVEALKTLRDDPEIKAVVLHVVTPGGVVAPAQEMHDAVRRAAEVKPVVASFGAVAASGGYYLAAPATKIVANPGTVTGSIGVILQLQEYRVLMDKVGLRAEAIKSGPLKDAGSPLRAMTDADRAAMQSMVDDIFDQFLQAVAQGRKLDIRKVRELADGRIYSGRQAKALGLVDELGGFEDAVALAGRLGGIEGTPKVQKIEKRRGGLLGLLLGNDAEAASDAASALLDPVSAPPLRFVLPGW